MLAIRHIVWKDGAAFAIGAGIATSMRAKTANASADLPSGRPRARPVLPSGSRSCDLDINKNSSS
jgi:hypothetical protein